MAGDRTLAALVATALGAVSGAGCKGAPCVRHSDCDPGLVCSPAGACLTPAGPDGGEVLDAATDGADDGATDAAIDGATDAATDAGIDGATDAATDAGTDGATDAATDAGIDGATDAATDAATDGAIDGTAPVLESPFAAPGTPAMDPTLGASRPGDQP